jgi:hypothetical protein
MKYHQKKSLILQVLDKLPSRLGYFIYHKIQNPSLKNIETKIKPNQASLRKIKQVLTSQNIDLETQTILEIGSGWYPILAFLFKAELKVNKIITYDINKHYSKQKVEQTEKHFKNIDYKINEEDPFNLPNFIEYHPQTDLTTTGIDKSVNFVYSRFVLEHVKPKDILNMHQKFRTELNDDIKILHLISPSDHRAYSDNSLSYYDFLKYSQAEWNNIQTKFDYHNRLRLPEYLYIFKKAGFKVSYIDHDRVEKNSDKYKMFKALKLHPDYQKFSEEEILAGSICVMLEKF